MDIGQEAPDFSLAAQDGSTIHLSDFRGKNIVLYFYPKDNTPGCTTEACEFRDAHQELQAAGAVVLGVSRDNAASHTRFASKYGLGFPLLADVDGKVCEAYGVLKEKTMFGKTGFGIERSTFIIDSDGKIAKVYRKVKVPGHVDEVLRDIGRL